VGSITEKKNLDSIWTQIPTCSQQIINLQPDNLYASVLNSEQKASAPGSSATQPTNALITVTSQMTAYSFTALPPEWDTYQISLAMKGC
jgi:hypothetical protein